mgnify:CR=1 FL=1
MPLRQFQARGLGRGDAINLIIQNSADFLILYFAALALGVVVSPINYSFTAREMSYIVKDSRGRMIFAEEEYLPRVEELRREPGVTPDVVVLSRSAAPTLTISASAASSGEPAMSASHW